MTLARSSSRQLHTTQTATTATLDRLKLAQPELSDLFNVISLLASHHKTATPEKKHSDVARILCRNLLRYFKSIFKESLPPLKSISALICSQLTILKNLGLFLQTADLQKTAENLGQILLLPDTEAVLLIAPELSELERDEFINELEEYYLKPQEILTTTKKLSNATSAQDLSPRSSLLFQLAQELEAQEVFRLQLLALNPSLDMRATFAKLFAPWMDEQLLLTALSQKKRDKFLFDFTLTNIKMQDIFNWTSLNESNDLSKLIAETACGFILVQQANDYCLQENFSQALTSYKAALSCFEDLQDFESLNCIRSNLIHAHIQQAYQLICQMQAELALVHCQQALHYLAGVAPASKNNLKQLASIHNAYAIAFHNLDNYDEALRYAQIEFALRIKLSTEEFKLDPHLVEAKENILKILINKALAYAKTQDFEAASKICNTLFYLMSKLKFIFSNEEDLRKYALLLHECSEYFYNNKLLAKTKHFISLEIKCLEKISLKTAEDTDSFNKIYRMLATIALEEAQSLSESQLLSKVFSVCEEGLNGGSYKIVNKNVEDLIHQSRLEKQAGLCCLELKETKKAAHFFEQEISTLTLIVKASGLSHYFSIKHAEKNLSHAYFQEILAANPSTSQASSLRQKWLWLEGLNKALLPEALQSNFSGYLSNTLFQLLKMLQLHLDNLSEDKHFEETIFFSLLALHLALELKVFQRQSSQIDAQELDEKLRLSLPYFIDQMGTRAAGQKLSLDFDQLNKALHALIEKHTEVSQPLLGLAAGQVSIAKKLYELACKKLEENSVFLNDFHHKASAFKKLATATRILSTVRYKTEEVLRLSSDIDEKMKMTIDKRKSFDTAQLAQGSVSAHFFQPPGDKTVVSKPTPSPPFKNYVRFKSF